MTTTENNPAHQSHLLGAVLFVQDFATLAVEDIRGNDLTGCLHSLNHVAMATDRALEALVIAAREDDTTWQMIGDALDMTRQAASEKYGPSSRRAALRIGHTPAPEADNLYVYELIQQATTEAGQITG